MSALDTARTAHAGQSWRGGAPQLLLKRPPVRVSCGSCVVRACLDAGATKSPGARGTAEAWTVTGFQVAAPTCDQGSARAQDLDCPGTAPSCRWMWLCESVRCCADDSMHHQTYLSVIHEFTASGLSFLASVHDWISKWNAKRVLDLTNTSAPLFFLFLFLASAFC